MMNRRAWVQYSAAWAAVACLAGAPLAASAADMAPDAMIRQLSEQVLNTLKTDQSIRAGDVSKITSYVDSVVMPNVDFRRMMASAVGPKWRTATAAQQQQLQEQAVHHPALHQSFDHRRVELPEAHREDLDVETFIADRRANPVRGAGVGEGLG